MKILEAYEQAKGIGRAGETKGIFRENWPTGYTLYISNDDYLPHDRLVLSMTSNTEHISVPYSLSAEEAMATDWVPVL